MTDSYRALCTDFYINHKLQTKMELPRTRETILDLFERLRRQFPSMNSFRRYKDELALESPQSDMPHRWTAIRSTHLRSGTVNPPSLDEGLALHKHLLETAPTYLSISPLDVDSIELLFGFDLAAPGNHDGIVFDAIFANSPFAAILDIPSATLSDCQPVVGITLGSRGDTEVSFEVKTRSQHPSRDPDAPDPISVFLVLRKFGPFGDAKELPNVITKLARQGHELVEHRLVPHLLVPIREAIASGNA